MTNETTKALLLVSGGVAVGGGLGYILTKRRLEAKYWEIANEEIESVKDAYRRRYKEEPYSSPESTLEALIVSSGETQLSVDEPYTEVISDYNEILVEEGYSDKPKNVPTFTAIPGEIKPRRPKNVKKPDEFVVVPAEEVDLPEPDPENPYLITLDQFMEDYENYDKISIVYYEGDDTLADEKEQIIPDVERTVGQENLFRFGQASGDKNVVYIRNERLEIDFEVVREEDGYAHTVLGLDENFLAHQEKPRVRKMRDERNPR